MVVTKKKNPFEKFSTELKIPAVLTLQVWDNDNFSSDDFLGTLSVNLSHFPQPSTTSEKCTLKKTDNFHENLFAVNGSVRGWFPVHGKSGKSEAIKQTVSLKELIIAHLGLRNAFLFIVP